jgi:hypothetical protein
MGFGSGDKLQVLSVNVKSTVVLIDVRNVLRINDLGRYLEIL